MAEVIGLGLTHYPALSRPGNTFTRALKFALDDPALPAELRSVENWPAEMQEEWSGDEGLAATERHRVDVESGLMEMRRRLDEFKPDVVIVWGDDQYELFQEDLIPPFCILAADEFEYPATYADDPNVWGETSADIVKVQGAPEAGRWIAQHVIDAGFDLAYSYKIRDDRKFPHAFIHTVSYLDMARDGFPFRLLPIAVNCYGKYVIARRGGMRGFAEITGEVDPPAPSPQRCMDLGGAIARAAMDSPWRVAMVASSSWSHAFLHDRAWHLHPDVETDRALYKALQEGDVDAWRRRSADDVALSGQQEMLNWYCLLGAAEEAGLKLNWSQFVETWICNSNKVFAVLD